MKAVPRDSEALALLEHRNRIRDLIVSTSEFQLFQQIDSAKRNSVFQDKSTIRQEKKEFAHFLSRELGSVIPKELRSEEELKNSWKKLVGRGESLRMSRGKKSSKKNEKKHQEENDEESLDIYEENEQSENSSGDV